MFLSGERQQFVCIASTLRQTDGLDAQSLQHPTDVDALAGDVDQNLRDAVDFTR